MPVSRANKEEISWATKDDATLQKLANYEQHGWLEKRTQVPTDVRHFWNVRDGIPKMKGILFHGDRIIIPTAMRPAMLRVLHEGHMGMEKTKARARVVLYWPNMGKDIEHMVTKCPACLRFRKGKKKEPLKQHPIPARPWQTVAADIMSF